MSFPPNVEYIQLFFILNSLCNDENEEFLNTQTKGLLLQQLLSLPNADSWKLFIVLSLTSNTNNLITDQMSMMGITSKLTEDLILISPTLPVGTLLPKLQNVFKSFSHDPACLPLLLKDINDDQDEGFNKTLMMYLMCNNNSETGIGQINSAGNINTILPLLLSQSNRTRSNNLDSIKRLKVEGKTKFKREALNHQRELSRILDSCETRKVIEFNSFFTNVLNPYIAEAEQCSYYEIEETNEKLSEINAINEKLKDSAFLGIRLFQ
jgi:hypothetical protein